MSPVAGLVGGSDITKGEPVETCLSLACFHAGKREKDGPGDNPNWDEDLEDHAQKAHEEVGIEAICLADAARVCGPELERPGNKIRTERWRAFTESEEEKERSVPGPAGTNKGKGVGNGDVVGGAEEKRYARGGEEVGAGLVDGAEAGAEEGEGEELEGEDGGVEPEGGRERLCRRLGRVADVTRVQHGGHRSSSSSSSCERAGLGGDRRRRTEGGRERGSL